MARLGDIDFAPVETAAGTLGFSGEGYPYQKALYSILGWCDFTGAGLVGKTLTYESRRGKKKGEKGNMQLNEKGKLAVWRVKPSSIKVNYFRQIAINAVGLSNLGAPVHLASGEYQELTEPFKISVALMGETRKERLEECRKIASLFKKYFPSFKAKCAVQQNVSCPNSGHKNFKGATAEVLDEMDETTDILHSETGVPIEVKLSPLFAIWGLERVQRNRNCFGICFPNTIPWGELPDEIPWNKLFLYSRIFKRSPLYKLGGGGLSGALLRPISLRWIRAARAAGFTKPISGGGGILRPWHVDEFKDAGADSVFIGAGSFLASKYVQPTIQRAYEVYGGTQRQRSQIWR